MRFYACTLPYTPDYWCEFRFLTDLKEWISYECSDEEIYINNLTTGSLHRKKKFSPSWDCLVLLPLVLSSVFLLHLRLVWLLESFWLLLSRQHNPCSLGQSTRENIHLNRCAADLEVRNKHGWQFYVIFYQKSPIKKSYIKNEILKGMYIWIYNEFTMYILKLPSHEIHSVTTCE